jgi:predicted patatin/cPLA2 family phospholipase
MNFLHNINLNLDVIDNIDNTKHNFFDLIIGGGGFRGYYHVGSLYIIKELEQKNKIKIRQIIGTSSGAIGAVNYACNVNSYNWIKSYEEIKKLMEDGLDLHTATIMVLREKLPKNAHELCNQHNVKIAVSYICFQKSLWPIKINEVLLDNFSSFNNLIDSLSASINIPYYTSNNVNGVIINNIRYYDAFFCRHTPIIINNDLPQLIIKTINVIYPRFVTLNAKDSYINLLALRGYLETYNFFKYTTNNNVIKWIEPCNLLKIKDKQNKENKENKEHNYLVFIIPLLFFIKAKYFQ